jgi:CubicO group peptidase (beta-lactamase class C family)
MNCFIASGWIDRQVSKYTNMQRFYTLPLLLISSFLFSQPQEKKKPWKTNFRINHSTLDSFENAIRKDIANGDIAGAAYVLYHKGTVVRLKALGESDVQSHRALQADDYFRLASMTKPIASLALLLLQEDGLVNMNDRLDQYLPAFANPAVVDRIDTLQGNAVLLTHPAQKPILLRHLLTHTAGFASQYGGRLGPLYLATFADAYANDLANFADRLASLPLNHEPGEEWVYGPSINIAARVVEKVSGMAFQEFLQQRIFGPMRMKDTRFFLDASMAGRLTTHYTRDENGKMRVMDPGSTASRLISGPKVYYSGSGGLNATIEDYLKFCVMVLNNGMYEGRRIARPETIAQMKTDQVPLNINADLNTQPGQLTEGFTFGYQILRKENSRTPKKQGTLSWGGATGPVFFIDPADQTICIYMVQMQPYSHIQSRKDFTATMLRAIHQD